MTTEITSSHTTPSPTSSKTDKNKPPVSHKKFYLFLSLILLFILAAGLSGSFYLYDMTQKLQAQMEQLQKKCIFK